MKGLAGAGMPKHRIDVTPDKSLVKKLGRIGYRTEQAIAELIDNSIDARVGGAREEIRVGLDFGRREVSVSDDGTGMGLDALRRAWVLGSSHADAGRRLGMFGIGMKSACSALGRSFSTRTTVAGSPTELSATYDEDRWAADGDWSGFEVEERETGAGEHGTTVSVSRLNVALYRGQVATLRERFGIRYARYMESGQVRISVNNKTCVPIVPDIDSDTRRKLDIRLPDGNRIHGWIALLLRRSIKGDYGLDLYQNDRLITSHAKFGVRIHPSVSRVVGEISLDHVPVNVNKTGFLTDSPEYREAVKAFENDPVSRSIVKKSEERALDPLDYAPVFTGDASIRLPRVGDSGSRLLLRKLAGHGPLGDGPFPIVLEEADSGVYRLVGGGDGTIIAVNQNSDVFRAFSNPIYFLRMLQLEARELSGHPEALALLAKRNDAWERFVADQTRGGGMPRERPGDTLPNGLRSLREAIAGQFSRKFQFTALSILYPFLHNAYRAMTHTLYTTPGSGYILEGIVSSTPGYRALLNPGSAQVYTAHDMLDSGDLVIIRERADVPKSTAATYSKAWVDFYAETQNRCAGVYEDELDMLWELESRSLVSLDEVLRLARRRKIGPAIRKYLGEKGAFG